MLFKNILTKFGAKFSADNIIEVSPQLKNPIFKMIKKDFGLQAKIEKGVEHHVPTKTVTPMDFKKMLRDFKQSRNIFNQSGQPYNFKTDAAKIFIREYSDKIDNEINSISEHFRLTQGVNIPYSDLVKEFAVTKRFEEVIGQAGPGHLLSFFQLQNIPGQVVPGKNLRFLQPTGAAAATGVVRLKTKFPKGVSKLQDLLSNLELQRRGIQTSSSNLSKFINPVRFLQDKAAYPLDILPKLTTRNIKHYVPGTDLDTKIEEKEGLLKKKREEIKKKIPEQARAGFDVEMIMAEDRIRNVINRRTPKEYREARATGEEPKVSKWRMKEFEDNISIALLPEVILGKIRKGNLTAYNVDDFKEANPYLYQRMAFDLFEAYKNGRLKLSYSQTLRLEKFLQRDITGLKGGVFNVNQESAEPIQALNQEVKNKGQYVRGTLLKRDTQESATPAQRYAGL